nr:ABC transporter permease [Rhodococcus sp. HNM0569]
MRAARGRFALISVVVVLVAVLVSFLSGLTAGLRHQNISALEMLDADSVVFADTGSGPSFDESSLTDEQITAWQRSAVEGDTAEGETVEIDPVGIARGRIGTPGVGDGGAQSTVAVIGADRAFGDQTPTRPGTVVLSDAAASATGASAGQTVALGDSRFTVADVRGDGWYGHSPVVWTTLADWRELEPRGGAATVLAVSGVTDAGAVDAATGTVTVTADDSFSALSSHQAENTSLTLMTVMLFAISALVIGAFFTVWTIQRTPDIATLKALGATTSSLVRDALGQALVVLVAGVAVGLGITTLAATLLGDGLPFVLDASTTVAPAAGLIGLGLVGAALALRFLVTTDPLAALNR